MTKNKQANDFQENQFPNICMGCMKEKSDEDICECGYDPETIKHPSHLKSGLILNTRYIAGKVLERGGFGITYIGFDKVLNRKVAIKEYFPSVFATRDTSNLTVVPLKGDEEQFFSKGMELFINEARNVAKFAKHPNIVNITDFFQENNTAYMVMDFLEGENLSKFLKERGSPLPVKQAIDILLPILDALKDVHSMNIYHRDISPQNVVITTDEVPILIDFGAARHIVGEQSKSLDLILKPGYSPFEAYTTKGEIGSWTDVYGCGATLYFMITGEAPPPAPDRILRDDLVQPSDIEGLKNNISYYLNNAILHSLSVKIDDRFKTVDEFEKALKGIEKDKKKKRKWISFDKFKISLKGKASKQKASGSIEYPMSKSDVEVFISYAKKDHDIAKKLFNDLEKAGISPWMDTEKILPGQNRKALICNAIKDSDYFLALISSNSISTQGHVQKELKIAMDLLAECSPSDIFVIPVRIDASRPVHENLQVLQYVDIFPSYEEGKDQILRVLRSEKKEYKEFKTSLTEGKSAFRWNLKKFAIIAAILCIVLLGIEFSEFSINNKVQYVTVNISASPEAEMYVNGEFFAKVPKANLKLPAGKIDVRFLNRDKKIDLTESITIEPDKPDRLNGRGIEIVIRPVIKNYNGR